MQDSGQSWTVGAIANDHVLVSSGRWVRLNHRPHPQAPRQLGDVINDQAFIGTGWIPLPAGWRSDPTGRHQLRWWTGRSWGSAVHTNGVQMQDPLIRMTPAAHTSSYHRPKRTLSLDLVSTLVRFMRARATVAWVLYMGFWLLVAIYSASVAMSEDNPQHLLLTATASLNMVLFQVTGQTRTELNRQARRVAKKNTPYILCGIFATVGVWLGLHFDAPQLALSSLVVALIGLMIAWAFN